MGISLIDALSGWCGRHGYALDGIHYLTEADMLEPQQARLLRLFARGRCPKSGQLYVLEARSGASHILYPLGVRGLDVDALCAALCHD